jgi:hypothetical protein
MGEKFWLYFETVVLFIMVMVAVWFSITMLVTCL